ncbi:hypothetical protein PAXRUDRAFT_797072 [Paxillus rubicundulus Ve08.2h10]|uniref:DUF7721 domain-containing protein n=1 Tax=Paxillus rubicundulus Ve08.2h10 TaxID=930991 RepID=A0A0D0DK58_9AGAM|nr:hypothetical protein PAXRUDRAFT_797072 [Paxillus rubicundulus Ve08.2h10]
MSGFNDRFEDRRERLQEIRDRREHHGGRREDHEGREGHHNRSDRPDADDQRSGFESGYSNQGYQAPPGPPHGSTAFASQGGLDRGDFASDVDIDRMMASGSFQGGQQRKQYDESAGPGHNNYGGYDAPARPSQNQGHSQQGYGTGGAYAPSYNSAPREGQYASPPGPPHGQGHGAQARSQYDEPPAPPPNYDGPGSGGGYGAGNNNAPSGGFSISSNPREGYGARNNNAPSGGFPTSTSSNPREGQYDGGYNALSNDQAPRRGEAASYYNTESGQANNYSHLAGIAKQHDADTDPELYHRASQGLHEKIQSQSRPPVEDSDDEDRYKPHFDAHKKAYGDDSDSHGPMDNDTIGAAAALEAFKQTAAQHQSQAPSGAGRQGRPRPDDDSTSSNAPAGGFRSDSPAGGQGAKPTPASDDEEEEEEPASRAAAGGGGMQDKLMALAMSQAGKLFDKKGGSASGGEQGKAQAMQSAAATAMQLFSQYKTTGKIEPTDMQKIMGVAMNLL